MADHELRIGADCRKCGRRNIEHANGQCPPSASQAYAYRGPEPDCRTCARCYATKGRGVYGCDSVVACTNGDRYQPLPPVKLWRAA